MHKGDIVTIYQDPATCQKPAGQARLLEHARNEEPEPMFEYWYVKFLDDQTTAFRLINTQHH